MHSNRCDCGCGRRFGLIRQRWFAYQFATRNCKRNFLRVKAQRRRVRRGAAVVYTLQTYSRAT